MEGYDMVRAGQGFQTHLFSSFIYDIIKSAMSINNVKKSGRGRPRVDSEAITVRMSADLIELLDAHISRQKEDLGRPEAIRRLVELGLKKERHNARVEDSHREKAARGERTWRGRRRAEERETMPQDEARRLLLADWRALPEEKRLSNTDRLLFAMKKAQKYPFKCSGEPYQTVMRWLEQETPGKGKR
jgi:hypothetical protein